MDSLPPPLAHIDCDHPRYCMETGTGPDGAFVNVTGGPTPMPLTDYPKMLRDTIAARRAVHGYRPANELLVVIAWQLQAIANLTPDFWGARLATAAFLVGWVADHEPSRRGH